MTAPAITFDTGAFMDLEAAGEAEWHDATVSDTIAAFAYLWDGSQPGWRLRVSCRYERRLVLHFGASGPSVRQVAPCARSSTS